MRVAAVQLNSTADRAANLAAADRLTRAAAADGAKLIVLPEKWTAMGSDEQLRAAAEPLDGPAIALGARRSRASSASSSSRARCSSASRDRRSSPTPPCTWTRTGELGAVYRKVHMFDVEVGGRVYRESELEQPGEEIVLSRTADGVELGMSICYDLRFPELYRILAVRGARVIVVPAAFTLATTRDHWETLLRARAIENQAFVIAANQIGAHPAGQRSGGRSMIVDPWGVVLAQAPDGEGHIVAELDLERQQRDPRAPARRSPTAARPPTAGPGEVAAA